MNGEEQEKMAGDLSPAAAGGNTATGQERSLETIAGEINTIKRQARTYITNSCIEIGERLCEAKRLIGHGNWTAWLEESVDYSERTAQNLMKIYQKFGVEGSEGKLFGKELNPEQVKELNYTQMTALLKIHDDDERAEFMDANPVQTMSTRELEAKIKELNAAREKAEKEREEARKDADYFRRTGEENVRKAEEARSRMEEAKNKAEAAEEFSSQQAARLRKELEEEKNKPVATAVVREMPEEMKEKMASMEKELETLRARGGRDENESAFAFAFEAAKRDVRSMLGAAEKMDPEKKAKYLRGAKRFFEMMADAAGEEK